MTPWTKLLGAIVVLSILSGVAISAHAQYSSNLTPYLTSVGTENKNLNFSQSPVAAFKPITVTCPSSHAAGCTIVVQVSSQFHGPQNCCDWGTFFMGVRISGSGSQIWPSADVRVGNGGMMQMWNNAFANAETFQWMKTAISAGDQQTVLIGFHTDGFSGTAGYRTAVVHLYLN